MGQGEKETVNRDDNVRQGLGGKRLLKDLASGLQKEQSYSAALAGCRNLHLLQCSNTACKPVLMHAGYAHLWYRVTMQDPAWMTPPCSALNDLCHWERSSLCK